jgi:hypothetical protein
VDTTATIERKLGALRCHESQIRDFEGLEARMREWGAEVGKEIGTSAADGFFHIVIDDDDDEGADPAPAAATSE